MAGKKAQGGLQAALLVAIIAGLLMLYIIFLPTSIKKDLFGNATIEEGEGATAKKEPNVLLSEHPGRLEHITQGTIEHAIPSINLFSEMQATVLKSIDSLSVKSGTFSKERKDLSFSIEDMDTVSNLVLAFNVKRHEGVLEIKLNGKSIYRDEIQTTNINPIALSPEDLKEGLNSLEFTVSSPGLRFWKSNEYLLENVRVIGDITDVSTQLSEVVFLVSDTEKINLDKTKLRFLPECNQREVGKLDILINRKTIFSAVPDCGVARPLEFDPEYLISGENRLEFRTTRGRYLIEQIAVKNELKEQPSFTYFFELSSKQFKKVEDDNADVNATFKFTDDVEFKEADLFVNGRKSGITRTRAASVTKNLDIFVEEGSNSFKIVPKTTLEIKDLKIEYKEK